MCWAHAKRRFRGRPVQVMLPPQDQTALERLTGLGLEVAEADQDEAYALAVDRLRKGALAYAWKLGWRPCGKCPHRR
jgi:hypothetical protein